MSQAAPHWKQSEPNITHQDLPVHVHNRMTEDEVNRFCRKADKLLEEFEEESRGNYEIQRLAAYGHHSRIGIVIKQVDDPLRNGFFLNRLDSFRPSTVKPRSHDEVYIRLKLMC
jgi:Cdc6-like AAA superfamily ATPase